MGLLPTAATAKLQACSQTLSNFAHVFWLFANEGVVSVSVASDTAHCRGRRASPCPSRVTIANRLRCCAKTTERDQTI